MKKEKEKIVKKRQPAWVAPMLTKLIKKPFSDSEWIFEKKFDGIRCLVFSKNKKIRMLSRNRLLLNSSYPSIFHALSKHKNLDFIMDSEIVYDLGKLNSFSKLQKLNNESKNVKMFVFDLLFINGYDIRNTPLINRKKILKTSFNFDRTIRFSTHRKKNGLDYFKSAVSSGFEGVIAKELNAPYESRRSSYWLKIKSVNRQEFVICGYTKPSGQRKGFGALLIGFYKNKKLQYAGKVGTGFDYEDLKRLSVKLKSLTIKKCPFENIPTLPSPYWVKPKIVCECSFTEWTDDNKLRHPSYLGLREDKIAKKVKKE